MKVLNKLSFGLLITSSVINAQTQNTQNEKFSKLKNTYVAPCQKLYGSALVDCMDSLNDETFLIQLYLLKDDNNQRKLFFEKKLTSPEEYEKFYKRFKSDEEWQSIEDQFSPEERAFFPNIHTKKQQEDDVYSRKVWRAGKYVGYGVGALAVIGTGGYGAVLLYNYIYAAGAAAKVAELALAAKLAAGGITAEQAAAGGATIIAGALCGGNPQNQQEKIPS
jgi:hypothetical protein